MTAGARIDSPAPSSLRLVLTLAIAGLISGVAIIGIYEATLPTITANNIEKMVSSNVTGRRVKMISVTDFLLI